MGVSVAYDEEEKEPFKKYYDVKQWGIGVIQYDLSNPFYRPGILVLYARQLLEVFLLQLSPIVHAIKPSYDVTQGAVLKPQQTMRRRLDFEAPGYIHAKVFVFRQVAEPLYLGLLFKRY